MQRHITILTIALLLLAVGCANHEAQTSALLKEGQRLEARRTAVLASARQAVAFAHEFDQLFSGVHASASEGRFGWNYDFEVGLYGRYVIKGAVPLTVDTNTLTVVRAGSPIIYVREIGRIIASPGDVGGYATFTTNQAQLGAVEWRKLIDSHGDFSVVGYPMVTNMPLPHFDRICHFPGSVNR
jgi:hypothetical protein